MSGDTRRLGMELKDCVTGILRVRKLCAIDLPNLELFGRTDPFVELTYLGLSYTYLSECDKFTSMLICVEIRCIC